MKSQHIRSAVSALLMAGSLSVFAQAPQTSPAPPAAAPAPKPMPSPDDLEPAVDTSATAPSERTAPAQSTSKSDAAASSAAPAAGTSPRPAPAAGVKPAPAKGGRAMDRLDLETTEITGNRELPKVLYIVPWKRSDLGDLIGKPVNSLLDEVLEPVDRDVFRRENRYYRALAPDSAQGTAPAAPK